MSLLRALILTSLVAACGGDRDRPVVPDATRQQVERSAARVAATRHERVPLFEPAIPGNALIAYRPLLVLARELDDESAFFGSEHFDPSTWKRAPDSIRALASSFRVRTAAESAVRGARSTFIHDPERFETIFARWRARGLLSLAANDAFERGETARAVRYLLTSLRLGDDLSRAGPSFQGMFHRDLDDAVLDQLEAFVARGDLSESELRAVLDGLDRIIATPPTLIEVLRYDSVLTSMSLIETADDGGSPRDKVGDLNQEIYDDAGVAGLVDAVEDLQRRWERDLGRGIQPERAIRTHCSRELAKKPCDWLSELPAALEANRMRRESTYLAVARQLARRSPAAVADVLRSQRGAF